MPDRMLPEPQIELEALLRVRRPGAEIAPIDARENSRFAVVFGEQRALSITRWIGSVSTPPIAVGTVSPGSSHRRCAVIGAPVHSAVHARDATWRQRSPYSRFGAVE